MLPGPPFSVDDLKKSSRRELDSMHGNEGLGEMAEEEVIAKGQGKVKCH